MPTCSETLNLYLVSGYKEACGMILSVWVYDVSDRKETCFCTNENEEGISECLNNYSSNISESL